MKDKIRIKLNHDLRSCALDIDIDKAGLYAGFCDVGLPLPGDVYSPLSVGMGMWMLCCIV